MRRINTKLSKERKQMKSQGKYKFQENKKEYMTLNLFNPKLYYNDEGCVKQMDGSV